MSTYDERKSRYVAGAFVDLAHETMAQCSLTTLEWEPVPSYLIAGSWRRGCETIGDIDVVVITDRPDLSVFSWPEMQVTPKRVSGWLRLDDHGRMMLDGFWCPPESAGACALFLTGPADLNVYMRQVAQKQNLKLNQYGLWAEDGVRVDHEDGKLVHPEQQEFAVFSALGLPWLSPAQRESWRSAEGFLKRKEVKKDD